MELSTAATSPEGQSDKNPPDDGRGLPGIVRSYLPVIHGGNAVAELKQLDVRGLAVGGVGHPRRQRRGRIEVPRSPARRCRSSPIIHGGNAVAELKFLRRPSLQPALSGGSQPGQQPLVPPRLHQHRVPHISGRARRPERRKPDWRPSDPENRTVRPRCDRPSRECERREPDSTKPARFPSGSMAVVGGQVVWRRGA